MPVKQTLHLRQCLCSPELWTAVTGVKQKSWLLHPLDKDPSRPEYSFIQHSWDKRNGKQADWLQWCPCPCGRCSPFCCELLLVTKPLVHKELKESVLHQTDNFCLVHSKILLPSISVKKRGEREKKRHKYPPTLLVQLPRHVSTLGFRKRENTDIHCIGLSLSLPLPPVSNRFSRKKKPTYSFLPGRILEQGCGAAESADLTSNLLLINWLCAYSK